jgi:hypothetical protein
MLNDVQDLHSTFNIKIQNKKNMLKNYFKIAWRSLMKNKTFSFINIFGLSIGLTCCLLIALYLNYELSYDKQHPDGIGFTSWVPHS